MAEKAYKDDDKDEGGFKTFIWNPRTSQFCGRTGSSWAKILLFYLIFYACLAAFWAIMLLIFYQTIDEREPKWKLDESRIGTNPGLGFRPRPPSDKIDSTLVRFSSSKPESYAHWVDDLENFVKPYHSKSDDTSIGEHVASDSECGQGVAPASNKFCRFTLMNVENNQCTNESQRFGYENGKPCVLVKLNRIFDWKPIPYEVNEVPKELDKSLKASKTNYSRDNIYITCDGEAPVDREYIGAIEYYPSQGIKANYFPFRNQPGYLSPIVFVKFKNPDTGRLLNIECKAWAKNIRHSRTDREGSVHFELLVD